jgi:hypothetical protein
MFINGEMREKRADMIRGEFFGMSLLVEKNIPLNPISVSLFRPQAEVFEPRDVAYLIEQFSLWHATNNTDGGGLSPAFFYDGTMLFYLITLLNVGNFEGCSAAAY